MPCELRPQHVNCESLQTGARFSVSLESYVTFSSVTLSPRTSARRLLTDLTTNLFLHHLPSLSRSNFQTVVWLRLRSSKQPSGCATGIAHSIQISLIAFSNIFQSSYLACYSRSTRPSAANVDVKYLQRRIKCLLSCHVWTPLISLVHFRPAASREYTVEFIHFVSNYLHARCHVAQLHADNETCDLFVL